MNADQLRSLLAPGAEDRLPLPTEEPDRCPSELIVWGDDLAATFMRLSDRRGAPGAEDLTDAILSLLAFGCAELGQEAGAAALASALRSFPELGHLEQHEIAADCAR